MDCVSSESVFICPLQFSPKQLQSGSMTKGRPPPIREVASSSPSIASCIPQVGRSKRLKLTQCGASRIMGRRLITTAVLQQDRRLQDKAVHADAASRPELRHQVSASSATADSYVSLNEAQDVLSNVVDANSPTPPVLLKFCKSGQQVRSNLSMSSPHHNARLLKAVSGLELAW